MWRIAPASGWLQRLVRPWLPLRGSHVLGFRRWRWLLVRNIHYATPLPVGVEPPDRDPSQVQPHRRAVRTGHRHLVVRPGRVRQLAIGRERHLA